jgi:dCMP deaminase
MASSETAPLTLNPPALGEQVYISTTVKIDDWDEYFSIIAEAVKQKSKDTKCKVGAVIVSADRVVLSTGFNGLPRGVEDDKEILEDVDEKLKVICHAEQNAIINAARMGIAVRGASIYVTKFPCLACCNSIIQAGIKQIFTLDDWFWDNDPFDGVKDGNHWRKRRLLRSVQGQLEVDAPNHPEYSPNIRFKKMQSESTNIEADNGAAVSSSMAKSEATPSRAG